MSRAIVIVLDSVGVGAQPDARLFDDENTFTLKHVKEAVGDLRIPNLIRMGLYNIDGLQLPETAEPIANFGKSLEKTPAKDTSAGHFELMGLVTEKPYKVFLDGFPPRIIDELERRVGTKTIGNYPSSGTEIIRVLGKEHVETGYPIVYTSADSVMQIAMHEEVIPLDRQYEICGIARSLLSGDDTVQRVICRPFVGNERIGFTRTENRRDFSVDPPGDTLLDVLSAKGYDVIAIGKIEDIFNNRGITEANHTRNNAEGIEATIECAGKDFNGLLFANLVDFDMLYGHRNDAKGYAKALEYFDANLPRILEKLRDDDLLIITADHGCDPTTKGTDHTREYIPILAYGLKMKKGVNLHVRNSFADIAATVGEHLGAASPAGVSFLDEISDSQGG
ncbi:MAG: phosphopentomutase [Clostridiales Family XIII bacterium]|jgi:phosphopentomutase|nr:phosphopentomutase [Clostridiales Family XIII bacterium]